MSKVERDILDQTNINIANHVNDSIFTPVREQVDDQVKYPFVESISIYVWRDIHNHVEWQVGVKIGESCDGYAGYTRSI